MESRRPTFSILLPTRGRPQRLRACLEALAAQEFPPLDFEVIVVDDGGSDFPEDVAAGAGRGLNLTVLRQAHAGPAAARNRGAAAARGRFLAFTDDDCAPSPQWLASLAQRFSAAPDQVIGGKISNALPGNIYSTGSQLLIDYLYSYYNADAGAARFLTSNNLAVPAEGFRALGGFDPGFPLAAGEDRDFCDRWAQRGGRMTYAPEALVDHAHELSLASFWGQHFRYGRGAYFFHRARERRGQGPVRVEPLSFYLKLLRYPFSRARGPRAVAISALFALSQLSNTAGFFWQRYSTARRRR
jgi:glycosyltransferase involved in cell wall biosynthesis